jgi:2-polyprenyl-6-methoxyphenol hydroxylase-like FAD-dependent oxidoreductase
MKYDVIVVGGGLAGSTLAEQLVRCGKDVLVLEREAKFKDRVRGENMLPWGAAAAKRLGIIEELEKGGAHRPGVFTQYAMGEQLPPRDLRATTPGGDACINMYHPALQEALLNRAVAAGADVLRGATVIGVEPGEPPSVTFEHNGKRDTQAARVVVGADGRSSQVRNWANFEVMRNPDMLTIAGTLLDDTEVPEDSVHLSFAGGTASFLAPLGAGKTRAYFIYPGGAGRRGLTGKAKVTEFLDAVRSTRIPSAWLSNAKCVGPLAEFEGADKWVPSPAKDAVALIGDAAASSDPSWGSGLSLTLLDVENLSNALCADDDWSKALARYARKHDEYYGALHRILAWMTELVWTPGPEADERRGRVFPKMHADRTGFPDAVGLGPFGPSDEQARRLVLGLD